MLKTFELGKRTGARRPSRRRLHAHATRHRCCCFTVAKVTVKQRIARTLYVAMRRQIPDFVLQGDGPVPFPIGNHIERNA